MACLMRVSLPAAFMAFIGLCICGGVLASDGGGDQCLSQTGNADRAICIRQSHFNEDLCVALEHLAHQNNLPPDFFARLIWRESLFRPQAVSSKGAEGIAQFMPATARQQGLADSFDVTAALDASARYLKRLGERFGNLGLAAAAYNAGEAAVARFLTSDRLPIETRDYVFAITGSTAEQWRDNPPETIAPALGGGTSFQASCVSLATRRSLAEPILTSGADWAPWGVQISAHYNPSIANKLFNSAIGKLPPQLKDQKALIVRQRGGNFGYRPRYAARIGRENRDEAVKLCSSIRAAGIPCTVFRNR